MAGPSMASSDLELGFLGCSRSLFMQRGGWGALTASAPQDPGTSWLTAMLQTRFSTRPACRAAVVNTAGQGLASASVRLKCQSQGQGLTDSGLARVFWGTRKSGSSKWPITSGSEGLTSGLT